jgi:hypothetical protein
MDILKQEAFKIPNRHDQKRISPSHILVKIMSTKQRKNIESCERKKIQIN